MTPSVGLRLYLCAWLLGIMLSVVLPIEGVALGLIVLSVTFFHRPHYWLLALGILFLGSFYGSLYERLFYPSQTASLVGQTLEIKAVVQGEPRLYAARQQVRLKILAWRQTEAWQPLRGYVLWPRAPLPALSMHDEIVVKGTVSHLVRFSEDFDTQAYWARWGISQQLIRAQLLSRPPPRLATNLQWRETAQSRLAYWLEKPHLTVALGMLVGLKEKLPKSLDEAFKQAGLTHLLVVSGTNVTLLVLVLSLLLKPLPPWFRYGFLLLGIGLYLYLVGLDPPALRAGCFGMITALALTSGWFCEYRNLLLVVASLMGLYDPHFLTYDVSFHLSFCATAGIMWGVPWLYLKLQWLPYKNIKLLLCASFCAQLAVFPILILQFGSFPYAGLLTNLITEPLVPTIMFFAAGGIVFGKLSFFGLESLWQLILWGSIEGLIKLAQIGALLPNVSVPDFLAWTLVALWVLFFAWSSFSRTYQHRYWERFEAEML